MKMQPVDSSSLSAVGYDRNTSALRVTFLHGGTYDYYNVPRKVYEGLLCASSKGRYYTEFVKAAGYDFKRIY